MYLFKLRSVLASNLIAILCSSAMLVWSFFSVLFMQLILGYSPFLTSLAFLPATITAALISILISGKLVIKFGATVTISLGLLATFAGLILFAGALPVGNFYAVILPGMILFGLGSGLIFNPLLLVAISDVGYSDSGIASGVINTSFTMGGALGLAVITSLTSIYTSEMISTGIEVLLALDTGYTLAFLSGALLTILALLLNVFYLRIEKL